MRKLTQVGALGLAATVTGGLMAYTIPTAFGENDDGFKRNEDTPDVVMTVDDDDDDDTNRSRGNTNANTNAGVDAGVSNDDSYGGDASESSDT